MRPDTRVRAVIGIAALVVAGWPGAGLPQPAPVETISIVFTRRHGERVQTTVSLAEDPEVDVVPVERAGGSLSDAQRRLRDGWLASRAP
jgi:hypothetical protein